MMLEGDIGKRQKTKTSCSEQPSLCRLSIAPSLCRLQCVASISFCFWWVSQGRNSCLMPTILFLCVCLAHQEVAACPRSMQVSEVICLTYRDGPAVFIPDSLVQQDSNGRKWLRLRPSSPVISRLVLGHLAQFRHLKNPSLAASPQLRIIQEKLRDSVLHFEHSSAENMFGEPEPDSEASNKPKDKKRALENAPDIVNVQLGSLEVEFKKPSSYLEGN